MKTTEGRQENKAETTSFSLFASVKSETCRRDGGAPGLVRSRLKLF
jgi:hypothetical protein